MANRKKLHELLNAFFTDYVDVELVSLCSTDGFIVGCFMDKKLNIEEDKLAALASSLFSISNASAGQIINHKCSISTIETDAGNIFFTRTKYIDLPCVLCVAVNSKKSLAESRFLIKRLADAIEALEH